MEHYVVDAVEYHLKILVEYHIHSLSIALAPKEDIHEDMKHVWNVHASNAHPHKALLPSLWLRKLLPNFLLIISGELWVWLNIHICNMQEREMIDYLEDNKR